MYSLNSAKRTRRHYFYSIHMKWRLTCVVCVVFVFLIIVFVIGGWKSPICERPCVQIIEQYMMDTLKMDKFGSVRFSLWKWVPSYQNALKYQSAKGPLELGRTFFTILAIFCGSLFKFVENAFQPSFSERSLGERWNGFFYQRLGLNNTVRMLNNTERMLSMIYLHNKSNACLIYNSTQRVSADSDSR